MSLISTCVPSGKCHCPIPTGSIEDISFFLSAFLQQSVLFVMQRRALLPSPISVSVTMLLLL